MTTTVHPFTVVDVAQRSPEWFSARAGLLTSSTVAKVFANGKKGEESVQRRDLRIKLACEQLTGVYQDGGDFRSSAMVRGVEREGDARLVYEAYSGRLVEEVGLLVLPDVRVGASLDGFVGDYEGIVEFKCPKTATHLDYLRAFKADPLWVPVEYMPQIRHQIWISGAQWCDFVSYDDRMPEGLQLLVRRIERDEDDIRAHEWACRSFLSEVEKEMDAIRELAA